MSTPVDKEFVRLLKEVEKSSNSLLDWLCDNKGEVFLYEDCYYTIRDYVNDVLDIQKDCPEVEGVLSADFTEEEFDFLLQKTARYCCDAYNKTGSEDYIYSCFAIVTAFIEFKLELRGVRIPEVYRNMNESFDPQIEQFFNEKIIKFPTDKIKN